MSRPGPRPFKATVTRYYDREGKRCARDTPGAKKRSERTETWYAKIGGVKVSLGTTDEGQAWAELRRRLRDRAERRAGIRDEFTDHAARPLAEHARDLAAVLRAKGTTEKQVEQVTGNLLRLAAAAGWEVLGDVTADSCLLALAALVKARGVGPRTRNEYLKNAQQLTRWAAGQGRRLRRDPLAGLASVSQETDVRHARRPPSEEEVGRLMAHLHGPTAKGRRGMSGPQRALGYRLCMATGFRAGELRSLTRESFDLDRGTATVAASFSKRRRLDVQPLPAWLVAELRAWFAAGGDTWGRFPARNPGPDVLRPDLEACGVPYTVPSPRGPLYLDFHSLRHFYLTWAANHPGISPKTLQALARHSSPALTLKIYSHARQDDLRRAVDSMPRPGQPRSGG